MIMIVRLKRIANSVCNTINRFDKIVDAYYQFIVENYAEWSVKPLQTKKDTIKEGELSNER